MPESDVSLIETVADSTKFGDKLELLINAMRRFEKAKSDSDAAVKELEKRKAETDTYVNAKKAELAVVQKKHDDTAREAAERIKLGEAQMAEVLRVKKENEDLAAKLAAKEKDLAGREHILKDQLAGIAALRAISERGADLVKRQQAHMAAMPKQ